MRLLPALVVAAAISSLVPGAGARPSGAILIPPLDAAISRPFQAPAGPYSSGHRGVDFAAPPGTHVRAAASGTVVFAGRVAGLFAVTIRHEDDVRTTYSQLSGIEVRRGEEVQQGQWIGTSGVAHAGGEPGLHLGVKIGDAYVDPATLLAPADVTEALHLAPLAWQPAPAIQRLLGDPRSAGDYGRACSPPAAIATSLSPPDDNIAVAVAGIASKTAGGLSADMYESGPERFGYPANRIFWFSYRGARGFHLHQPYARSDTYADLRVAATRLRQLMLALGRRYPGVDVDLFAHSQGGVVARLFLESADRSWDPRLPRVAHFVTFSTPHEGAPLAGLPAGLGRSWTGSGLLHALSRWSRSGAAFPDPLSAAIAGLAPGSSVMDGLARQDVTYGTQVLTLSTPFDLVVPADRGAMRGERSRVIPPSGLWAHSAIVRSEAARRLVYSFLRGGPIACRGWWDHHGPAIGAAIDWIERGFGWLLGRPGGALWPSL